MITIRKPVGKILREFFCKNCDDTTDNQIDYYGYVNETPKHGEQVINIKIIFYNKCMVCGGGGQNKLPLNDWHALVDNQY